MLGGRREKTEGPTAGAASGLPPHLGTGPAQLAHPTWLTLLERQLVTTFCQAGPLGISLPNLPYPHHTHWKSHSSSFLLVACRMLPERSSRI